MVLSDRASYRLLIVLMSSSIMVYLQFSMEIFKL